MPALGSQKGFHTCEKCKELKGIDRFRVSKFNRRSRVCLDCGHRCKDCGKNEDEAAFYTDKLDRLSARCKLCSVVRVQARQAEWRANKITRCICCGGDSRTVEFYRRSNGYIKQPCAPCTRQQTMERHARKAEERRSATPIFRIVDAQQALAEKFLRLPRFV